MPVQKAPHSGSQVVFRHFENVEFANLVPGPSQCHENEMKGSSEGPKEMVLRRPDQLLLSGPALAG